MKKNSLIKAIALSTFLFLSCEKDDDSSSNSSQQIAQVEATVEAGTWRITNFTDSGQDETLDFTGYNFTFASDGTLTASNGTNTLNGTWSITNYSSSSDDDSNDADDIEFNIFFPVPESNDFEDLNDDWDIVSTSATKIQLIDVSGGNGGTDTLTFEKN